MNARPSFSDAQLNADLRRRDSEIEAAEREWERFEDWAQSLPAEQEVEYMREWMDSVKRVTGLLAPFGASLTAQLTERGIRATVEYNAFAAFNDWLKTKWDALEAARNDGPDYFGG